MTTCPCGCRWFPEFAQQCPKCGGHYDRKILEQKKVIGVQGVLELIKIKEAIDEKLVANDCD